LRSVGNLKGYSQQKFGGREGGGESKTNRENPTANGTMRDTPIKTRNETIQKKVQKKGHDGKKGGG